MATEKNISKKFTHVKKMPPLRHKVGEGNFDITKSEVVQWLVKQPEIMQWIFDHVNNLHRKNGEELLIKYNSNTGKWQGVDYED